MLQARRVAVSILVALLVLPTIVCAQAPSFTAAEKTALQNDIAEVDNSIKSGEAENARYEGWGVDMDKKVRRPRVGRAERCIGGSPPAPRILIAATLAIIMAAAVVSQARVGGQAGDSNGPRQLPAITGTAITWGADVEFESALLVVVGRSQTNSLTHRTFGRREAIHWMWHALRCRMAATSTNSSYTRSQASRSRRAPEEVDGARGQAPPKSQKVNVRSGVFLVRDGLPILPEDLEKQRPTEGARERGGLN